MTVPNGVCLSEIQHYRNILAEFNSPVVEEVFDDDHPTILFVSRLVPRKRAHILIDVMPRVLSSIPNARLVIVGEGSERQRLEQMAKDSKARESIFFLGGLSETDKWLCYDRCDLYVLPSIGEGFGIGYLEANAFGKPVIGSKDAGTLDAVIDGHTGILVDSNDSEELAHAIIHLLRDPIERKRLGENGRCRVESHLNWRTIAVRVKDLIHSDHVE